jgi:hypothetical protein
MASTAIKYGDLVADRKDPQRIGTVQGSFTIPEGWPQPEQLFCWADGALCQVDGGSQPCLANDGPYEPGRYLVVLWDDCEEAAQPADMRAPPRLDRVRAETVRLARKHPSPRRNTVALRGGEIEVPAGVPPRRAPVVVRGRAVDFHVALRVMLSLTHSLCRDCGWDTCSDKPGDRTEWYTVHDSVWRAAGMRGGGQLCIGCLEARLGRRLARADFVDNMLNDLEIQDEWPSWSWRSERLIDRLSAGQPRPAVTWADILGLPVPP